MTKADRLATALEDALYDYFAFHLEDWGLIRPALYTVFDLCELITDDQSYIDMQERYDAR